MPNYYDQTMPLDPNTMQPYQAGLGQQQPLMARVGAGARGLLGNRDLALALLANSGASPQPRGFGEILGSSMMQADQMKSQRADDAFKRQYMMAQMQAMTGKNQDPSSVKEYQYAVQNGYKGTYAEWTKFSGQSSRPSSVQEWEYYNALPQDQKQLYLEMKRNPNFQVKDVNQVPTIVRPSVVGGNSLTPLSTTASEAAAASQVKQAENQGGAVGSAQGAITGGIITKGSNAKTVQGFIKDARAILTSNDSTGSPGGTFADALAGTVGISTGGAKNTAKLKVIQSGLMLNMPRMEGPQSDRDVQLYQQAAAAIGDSTIPKETRAAALDTIEEIQKRYEERAASVSGAGAGVGAGKPKETAAERAKRMGL